MVAASKVYHGLFHNIDNIAREFVIHHTNYPKKVLFASYSYRDYSGSAFVLFEKEGKLYEVNGSHCSCYGLGESSYTGGGGTQWKPEETSWEALALRKWDNEAFPGVDVLKKLIADNVGNTEQAS